MNRTLTIIVTTLAAILIVILAAVFFLVLSDSLGDGQSQAAATSPPTEQATTPAATGTAALPPPVVTIQPTDTPVPPTDTPAPTDTPVATDTPAPTATNTPAPVVVRPTNTPVPPTNTPAPTSPPAADTHGLTGTDFALQERSVFAKDQPVWFEFTVANNTGGPVPFDALGVMPKKDGQDRRDWYQHSWGGNNDTIPAGGLSWEDNIKLPEKGNYTLRLVICFDGYQACTKGGGTFITLSQEIPVTIN